MTDTDSDTDRIEFTPTVTPLLVKWVAVAVGSIAFMLLLTRLGSGGFPTVMLAAVALLLLLFTIRTTIRFYVLRSTTYEVSPKTVSSRYQVLYKYDEHEVPTERVRGIRVRQSRIQRLFGLGSLELVTTGENVGVSRLRIEHVDDPRERKGELADRIQEATPETRSAAAPTA